MESHAVYVSQPAAGRSHSLNHRLRSSLVDAQGSGVEERPRAEKVETFRSGRLTGDWHCEFWPMMRDCLAMAVASATSEALMGNGVLRPKA